jgi:hypothetical protein
VTPRRSSILRLALGHAAVLGGACASTPAIEAHVREEAGGKWLVVETSDGREISAVRFDPRTGREDFASQRLFGFDAAGLLAMEDRGQRGLIPPECERAARLWQGEFARHLRTPNEREVLKRQSEILAVCLDLIGVESHSDGCTAVPDFDFRSCCERHDRCYASGGTASDRRRCDVELRECIQAAGHPLLAQLYYAGVRAFGGSGFTER